MADFEKDDLITQTSPDEDTIYKILRINVIYPERFDIINIDTNYNHIGACLDRVCIGEN